MNETRAVIIRFDAIDPADAKALLDLIAETIGQDAITPASVEPIEDDTPTAPIPERSGDQVAKEVWEGIVRESAAETLAKKHVAIETGQQPAVAVDAKTLEAKKGSLRKELAKEGVVAAAGAVVKTVIEWAWELVKLVAG